MEATLPTHFLQMLTKSGLSNISIVGTKRSRIDLHIDDFLIEVEKERSVKRAWCYIDQRPEAMTWFDKRPDGTWPPEVSERSLW
jgi:hypothetical protein